MAKITYPTKEPGDQFFDYEADEIKDSVNSLYDEVNIISTTATDALAAAQVAQEDIEGLDTDKQNVLVSGTNIKTVGGVSILGGGDIPFPTPTAPTFSNIGGDPMDNIILNEDLTRIEGKADTNGIAIGNFSSDQITLTIFKVSNYATL